MAISVSSPLKISGVSHGQTFLRQENSFDDLLVSIVGGGLSNLVDVFGSEDLEPLKVKLKQREYVLPLIQAMAPAISNSMSKGMVQYAQQVVSGLNTLGSLFSSVKAAGDVDPADLYGFLDKIIYNIDSPKDIEKTLTNAKLYFTGTLSSDHMIMQTLESLITLNDFYKTIHEYFSNFEDSFDELISGLVEFLKMGLNLVLENSQEVVDQIKKNIFNAANMGKILGDVIGRLLFKGITMVFKSVFPQFGILTALPNGPGMAGSTAAGGLIGNFAAILKKASAKRRSRPRKSDDVNIDKFHDENIRSWIVRFLKNEYSEIDKIKKQHILRIKNKIRSLLTRFDPRKHDLSEVLKGYIYEQLLRFHPNLGFLLLDLSKTHRNIFTISASSTVNGREITDFLILNKLDTKRDDNVVDVEVLAILESKSKKTEALFSEGKNQFVRDLERFISSSIIKYKEENDEDLSEEKYVNILFRLSTVKYIAVVPQGLKIPGTKIHVSSQYPQLLGLKEIEVEVWHHMVKDETLSKVCGNLMALLKPLLGGKNSPVNK